jgi:hypothetical protein
MFVEQIELVRRPMQPSRQQQARLVGHQRHRLAALRAPRWPAPARRHQQCRGLVAAQHGRAGRRGGSCRALRLPWRPTPAARRPRRSHAMWPTSRRAASRSTATAPLAVDEGQQPLARAVPVDQEHDARADAREHGFQRRRRRAHLEGRRCRRNGTGGRR